MLAAYSGLNGGSPGNPVSVLFDPATEKNFFIADTNNVYATNTMGASFSTLAPGNMTLSMLLKEIFSAVEKVLSE